VNINSSGLVENDHIKEGFAVRVEVMATIRSWVRCQVLDGLVTSYVEQSL